MTEFFRFANKHPVATVFLVLVLIIGIETICTAVVGGLWGPR